MSDNTGPPFIFIYGPPGSGKTTLGSALADGLRLPFYDLDQEIATGASTSIPEIFAAEGETGFRLQERSVLEKILSAQPGVVALGGGALLNDENRALVEQSGPVLCLGAPLDILWNRLLSDKQPRPLLTGGGRPQLELLLKHRVAHYASFPVQLDTSDLSPERLAWLAQEKLGIFYVSGMGSGYRVWTLPGGLNRVGQIFRTAGLNGPVMLVSDENVAKHYAALVIDSLQAERYLVWECWIPAGEAHKRIETIMQLWNALVEKGIERRSTIIALGGGVVGDLAGFAAATYLRGVAWVYLPTSLLAMCDASLGGKTGIDLESGKNLVGAFYPPSLVLTDARTLDTLPEVEIRNGLAEVVKHGMIADPDLFQICSLGWIELANRWDEVVRRAMAVKIQIIQFDPYERELRAVLNFGHTLGHALELASGFRLRHGEAVAIGMVAATRLSEREGIAESGLTDRLIETLSGLGLPTVPPEWLLPGKVLEAIGVDKKHINRKVRLVLPVKIGGMRIGVVLDDPQQLLTAAGWREI